MKYPCLSVVKVTAEFNEKNSTSISLETVWQVLRTAGLNGHSAHRKFFVSAKSRKLQLLFTISNIYSKHTGIMSCLQKKAILTLLVLMVVLLYGEEKMSNFILRAWLEQFSMGVEVLLYAGQCQYQNLVIWYLLML